MRGRVVIATRGSQLALWQAEHVKGLLEAQEPGLLVELLVLRTTGDRIQDRPLHEVGGKGLFTKEIEEALLDRRADLAVHSMKDVPAHLPPGLELAAVPPREDPRDALLLRPNLRAGTDAKSPPLAGEGGPTQPGGRGRPLSMLPSGARVGTTSLRRTCLLRHLRPDLDLVPLRGNVDTRLRKLDAGDLDALVLAVAGLSRLGHAARIDAILPLADSVPAVGQGALGLECRADDPATRARLQRLSDPAAQIAVTCERAFLRELEGSCKTPLGAHAVFMDREGRLDLDGFVGSPDGAQILRAQRSGPADQPESLGRSLANELLSAGARDLLRALEPG